MKLTPIKIGNIVIEVPVFLAPIAGITDLPFRKLVSSLGANIVYSEMISSEAITRRSLRSYKMAELSNDSASRVVQGVQLAGSEINTLIEAGKIAQDLGADIIDINMGCPAKKVVNGIAGSALMKEEVLAGQIMEKLVISLDVPVTVKMRLGWDQESINVTKLAHIAQESGISLVTIHGRTRQQFFSNKANWSLISQVKDKVNIPIIINGDITDEHSTDEALQQSQADGIMVARGVYGDPWIINRLSNYLKYNNRLPLPTEQEKLTIMLKHYEMLLQHYGKDIGLKIARKHLSWYIKGLYGASEVRAKINMSENIDEVRNLVCYVINNHIDHNKKIA